MSQRVHLAEGRLRYDAYSMFRCSHSGAPRAAGWQLLRIVRPRGHLPRRHVNGRLRCLFTGRRRSNRESLSSTHTIGQSGGVAALDRYTRHSLVLLRSSICLSSPFFMACLFVCMERRGHTVLVAVNLWKCEYHAH